MRVLVTGGTGTLGGHAVPRLRDAGCDLRVLSRHSYASGDGVEFVTGDLATGEGIEAAVAGVSTVVHCAGSSNGDEDKARNLVGAASRAGVRHLVYISVVGADRIPIVSGIDRAMFGYFGSKLAAERAVADSGLPWTTLRATQFYDLLLLMVTACCVLLVACANIANLLLARGLRNRQQTAVRVALGASRGRLVRNALIESVTLSLIGGAAGVAVAWAGARLILYAGEPQSTRVVMQGPFVGEAGADISRLDEEYRQGRFPHMSELAHQ